MADEKKAGKEDTAKKVEKSYDLDVLMKDSVRLFGVTASTLCGVLGDREGPITLNEAKKAIETWKKGVAK